MGTLSIVVRGIQYVQGPGRGGCLRQQGLRQFCKVADVFLKAQDVTIFGEGASYPQEMF